MGRKEKGTEEKTMEKMKKQKEKEKRNGEQKIKVSTKQREARIDLKRGHCCIMSLSSPPFPKRLPGSCTGDEPTRAPTK